MIKVLIIEDEQIAAEKLQKMLLETDDNIEVVAIKGSISESVKWLMVNTVDLIFLDIQLSDGLSFSIFDQVNINTQIILTTAYDQYAIKAFQYNSIAYLLKPIRKSELQESLNKYKSLKSSSNIDFDELIAQIQGKKPDYKKRFLIQFGEKIKKVEVAEIAYFYVLDRGIYLKTFDCKSFPIDFSLDRLEMLINPSVFFRINRKFLINIDSISNMIALSRGRVKLELKPKVEDELETIVSIDRSSDFKKWMNS